MTKYEKKQVLSNNVDRNILFNARKLGLKVERIERSAKPLQERINEYTDRKYSDYASINKNLRDDSGNFNTNVSILELAQSILKGQCFTSSYCIDRTSKTFQYADIIGIDFDDGLSIEEFLKFNEEKKLNCFLIYPTFRYSEEHNKFRTLFLLPTRSEDREVIEIYISMLIKICSINGFNVDSSCKDVARLWNATNKSFIYINDDLNALDYRSILNTFNEWARSSEDNTRYLKDLALMYNLKLNNNNEIEVEIKENEIVFTKFSEEEQREQFKNYKENYYFDENKKYSREEQLANRTIISNLEEKLEYEPIYRFIKYGNGEIGYKLTCCFFSNIRFIKNDEVIKKCVELLYNNQHRFTSTSFERCIDEAEKILKFDSRFTAPLSYSGYAGLKLKEFMKANGAELPMGAQYEDIKNPLLFIKAIILKTKVNRVSNDVYLGDFEENFNSFDFINNKKGFVVEAGTGLGKTYMMIKRIEEVMKKQFIDINSKVYLVPRNMLKDNILHSDTYKEDVKEYNGNIEYFNDLENNKWNITSYQRFSLYKEEFNNSEDSLIIIDEAHTLFNDSIFNGATSYQLLEWLKNEYKGFIIWITATTDVLRKAEEIGTTNFNFKYLFKEGEAPLKYSVDKIDFYNVCNLKYTRKRTLEVCAQGHKVICMMKRLQDAYTEYRELTEKGLKVALIPSKYNEALIINNNIKYYEKLDEAIKKELEEKNLVAIPVFDIADWETADYICKNEKIPSDINVVVFTSVGREGFNIYDENVKLAYTNFTDKTSYIQFRGRMRQDLEEFIVVNDRYSVSSISKAINEYESLVGAQSELLAERYGAEKKNPRGRKFIIKEEDENGIFNYILNPYIYPYLLCERDSLDRTEPTKLFKEGKEFITNDLGVLSKEGTVNIYYKTDLVLRYSKEELLEKAQELQGAPLTENIIKDLIIFLNELGFTQANRKPLIDKEGAPTVSAKYVFEVFKSIGVNVVRKKATKKQAQEYNVNYRDNIQTFAI